MSLFLNEIQGGMSARIVEPMHGETTIVSETHATLILPLRGVLQATSSANSFTITASQAFYVPPAVPVRLLTIADHRLSVVRFAPDMFQHRLPEKPSLMRLHGLLRELVQAVVTTPDNTDAPRRHRLYQVLIDQLWPVEQSAAFDLPWGRDRRLLRVTTKLLENPAIERGLQEWASIAGASSRTLARLFLAETGMNFKNWRQKARILRAIELLEQGESTTSIAYDVGYDTPNAFIASFKATTGVTPTRYRKSVAELPSAAASETARWASPEEC